MLVHSWARVNKQISVHHPLGAHYDSVVHGTSTELASSFTLVTKCCKYILPQEGLDLSPSLVFEGCTSCGLSLAFPFVFSVMVPTICFYWIFCPNIFRE